MEPRRQRLSQRRKAAERSALVRSQSEVRQNRTESADLFRPQLADAAAALPGASQSAGAGPEDLGGVSLAVSSSRVPCSTQPAPVEFTRPIDAKATSALDAIPARSRRVKRFALLGALTIVGVAASMSLITPHRTPITVVDTGAEAPVAVTPASDLGASTSLPGNDHPAPVAAPIKSTEGAIPAAPAAAPTPRVTRNANRTVTTNRSRPDAATMAPQPDRRASSAEAYVRSRAAELREYDQRWKRLNSPRP
ncbi:MAG: hypothetical protein ACRDRA_11850 [Pseudonocardiaceae bacterium]